MTAINTKPTILRNTVHRWRSWRTWSAHSVSCLIRDCFCEFVKIRPRGEKRRTEFRATPWIQQPHPLPSGSPMKGQQRMKSFSARHRPTDGQTDRPAGRKRRGTRYISRREPSHLFHINAPPGDNPVGLGITAKHTHTHTHTHTHKLGGFDELKQHLQFLKSPNFYLNRTYTITRRGVPCYEFFTKY
jgi:hypothetical protein